MNEIAVLAPSPALPTLVEEMATAKSFALLEKAERTRSAYRSDFVIFVRWCDARGLASLPAAPETVAAFLGAQATAGIKASTVSRRVAAIRYAHRLGGFDEPPTNSELVKATLRGIRRTIGVAVTQKAPATAPILTAMLAHVPDDTLIGLRDRALLCLGFAGAFRRSELVALQVSDLVETPDGYKVRIRRSKTDQAGVGQTIAILRGPKLRPVLAVQAWLTAANITAGPVFRPIGKGGRVASVALASRSVTIVVKRYIRLAGLDPALYAGHSLRSGFVTSASEASASLLKMMEVSRHKSAESLRGYIRDADLFQGHAGGSFL